jgi:hypothetical protein
MKVVARTNSDGSRPVDREVTSASAWSYVGGVVAMALLAAVGGLDFTPLPDTVEVFVFPILGALTSLGVATSLSPRTTPSRRPASAVSGNVG